MSSFRVVLDTCVLYPAALANLLLSAADSGLYRLQWSSHILRELEDSLARDRRIGQSAAAKKAQQIRSAFPDAEVTGYESLIAAMTNDPKDRHVVAAAVQSGAQVVVTSNIKDFPSSALASHDVEAQTPDQFLVYLYDLQPDLMVDLVAGVAAKLKNPQMTTNELLQKLEPFAPRFVDRLRSAIKVSS
jgi:predicted nucleic acid-binding protein